MQYVAQKWISSFWFWFLSKATSGGQTGPDFQYRQTRHVPRAAALQGRHSHQKKNKQNWKMWETNSTHLLNSYLTLLKYRLIWYQSDGNFISTMAHA